MLEALPARDRFLVEEGLTFLEESAGRLMQREVLVAPAHWTVGQVIDFLRSASQVPNDFYAIFIVDPAHRPVGALYLDRLLRTKRPLRVADIMAQDFTAYRLRWTWKRWPCYSANMVWWRRR